MPKVTPVVFKGTTPRRRVNRGPALRCPVLGSEVTGNKCLHCTNGQIVGSGDVIACDIEETDGSESTKRKRNEVA